MAPADGPGDEHHQYSQFLRKVLAQEHLAGAAHAALIKLLLRAHQLGDPDGVLHLAAGTADRSAALLERLQLDDGHAIVRRTVEANLHDDRNPFHLVIW